MKNKLFVILVLAVVLLPEKVTAQADYEDKYASRYRLDLPEEWIKKPRLMKAITYILPETLTKIRDFDFCTVGKARYIVKLFIGRLNVFNEVSPTPIEISGRISSFHSFDYSFYAGFLLCDTNGKALSMLRLNDVSETYSYKKESVSYVYQLPMLPEDKERYGVNYNQPAIQNDLRLPQYTVRTEPSKLKSVNEILTLDFLERICVNKIFEIQKILRQISSTQ